MVRKRRGRPPITCVLGTKKIRSIECYDLEWQKIKIYFAKLKKERPKYYIENDEES